MPNRKRRLKKGIKSLQGQIEIHKQKKKLAEKEEKEELVDYYEKEIKRFKEQKEEKEKLLEKQ